MTPRPPRARPHPRLAGALWLVAAATYLGVEALAASAFSPPYSYARNYVSDLGVPACGVIFEKRPICSPLHSLMNANFVAQGLLFLAAALAIARPVATPIRIVFVLFAAVNCIGNVLVGLVPETAPLVGTTNLHVLGATLAIGFGNATALVSAWTFRPLGLPRLHRRLSLALPLVATLAALYAAVRTGPPFTVPNGVLERILVYTITAWQLTSAASVLLLRRPTTA